MPTQARDALVRAGEHRSPCRGDFRNDRDGVRRSNVTNFAWHAAMQIRGSGRTWRPSLHVCSFRWWASLAWTNLLHEFPGLAEFLEFRALGAWINVQRRTIFDDGRGKDVPGVLGENVSSEKINVLRTVWKFVAISCLYGIVRPSQGFGPYRFDLDAPKQFSSTDHEVVTFTVSPWFGYRESTIGGLAHKGNLGEFAARFIVEGCVRRFGRLSFFRDRQRGPKR